MLRCLRWIIPVIALTGLAGPLCANVVTDWNAKAEAIQVEVRALSPANARAMAIMHVAMFEAVNAIEQRYAPYTLKLRADQSVSKEAAAASAAHAVLIVLYPDRQAALDAMLKVSLSDIPEGQAKAKGI